MSRIVAFLLEVSAGLIALLLIAGVFLDISRDLSDCVLYFVLVLLLVALREQRLGRIYERCSHNLYLNRHRDIGSRDHHENYFERLRSLNSIKPMIFIEGPKKKED